MPIPVSREIYVRGALGIWALVIHWVFGIGLSMVIGYLVIGYFFIIRHFCFFHRLSEIL